MGKRSKVFMIIFVKLLTICFGLRCIANVFWPNSPLVQQLTCNGFHYLGNSPMLNLGMLAGIISGSLLVGTCQQYFILNWKSFRLQYINKIKYQRLDYRLNNAFNNKFFKKFNWISIWTYTQFIPVFLTVSAIYCTPTLIGNFDPELNYNLLGIIYFKDIQ